MRSYLLLLTGCCCCVPARGQNGFRISYDKFFETVTPASNGDLLLTQDVHTGVVPPFPLMRTDSLGATIWAKDIWTVEQVTEVVETATNDLLISTNWTDTATQRQCPAIVKMASDGTFLWARYFICDTVNTRAGSFVRASDGANILAVRGINGGKLKALIRFDDNGTVLWARKLSQDWYYQFDQVVPVESGSVLVLDRQSYYNSVMKINSAGQLLWMNEYDLSGSWLSKAMDAVRMPNGQYSLLLRPVDAISGHLLVVAINSAGAVLGNVSYTFPDTENILYGDMEVNGLGQLAIATNHGNGHELVLLTDGAGTVQWVKEAMVYQIFGGDLDFVDDQHFVLASGCDLPGAQTLLMRSDAALGIDGCFDPYSTTVSSAAVSITPLSYSLITPTISAVPFTPTITPAAIAWSFPCSTVGLEPAQETTIGLYPDPATDRLTLTFPYPLPTGSYVAIYNALGALVKVDLESGAVNVSALAPGFHIVQVFDMDQHLLGRGRFMKE